MLKESTYFEYLILDMLYDPCYVRRIMDFFDFFNVNIPMCIFLNFYTY